MRFRLRRLRLPAVAVLTGVLAPAAVADAMTVEVVDTAGRPQVAALTAADGQRWWTGPDGRAEVPSQAVVVSRAPGDGCGGAEGTVVSDGLASARVVLPALVRPSTRPELDEEERHLLELVAQHRAALGGRITRHADTLDRTADWYATVLDRAGYIDHCLIRSPTARAHATGFPGAAVGEALSTGGRDTAETHFDRWLDSPPHRATLESFAVGTFGVAHVGGTWVLLTSGDCSREGTIPTPLHGLAGTSCGWSAPGASGLGLTPDGSGGAGGPQGSTVAAAQARLNPHLRVTLRRSGRRIRVVARVAAGATGRIRLTVAGPRRYVRAGSRRLDTTLRLRPGRYAVSVAFSGTGQWRPARAATTLRVR